MATLTIPDALANRLQRLAEDNNTSLEVLIESCLDAHENGFQPHDWSHLLLESAYEGIWYVDMSQRIVYVNQRCANMLGYTAAEMIGKPLTDFVDDTLQSQLRNHMQKRQEQGYYYLEATLQRKDGSDKRVQVTASNVLNDVGQQIGAMALLTDITAQKQAEIMLHANLYQAVIESMTEGVIVRRLDNTVIDCNDSALKILGMSRDRLFAVGRIEPEWTIIQTDGTPFLSNDTPSKLTHKTGQPQHNQVFGVVKTDKTELWLSINTHPIFLTDSDYPDAVVSIFSDITAYRHAMKQAEKNAAYWQYFSNLALEGLAITEDGRIADVNNRLLEILGYERDEIIGSPVMNFVAEADRDFVRAQIAESPDLPYSHYALRKDGSTIMIEIHARLLESEGRSLRVTAVRDVTRRHIMEQELEKTRALLQVAVEQSPAGIIIMDVPDLEIQLINQVAMKIWGYDALSSTERRKYYDLDAWRPAYPDGTPYPIDEVPLVRAAFGEEVNAEEMLNSNQRWMLVNAAPVRNDEGDITASIAIFSDITKHKQAEEALRQSEERYRRMLENAPVGIFVVQTDSQVTIRYVNPAGAAILAAQETDEIVGLSSFDLIPTESLEILQQRLDNLTSGNATSALEYALKRLDGELVYVRAASLPIVYEGESAALTVLIDVTEKHQAETALQRRDAILSAVAYAAEQFLRSSSWQDSLQSVLKRLGQATQVDRVYVFHYHQDTKGKQYASQLAGGLLRALPHKLIMHSLKIFRAIQMSGVKH
ncbi:MAG: PAS domain S-box protein [Anaerolineae bacterium]|nr:PAS domain S-box protein [Anaerolineae bacterium]